MADVKISALPAATTPLDGTELAPIVQSGTTKRVTVANLTVGRALTASSLTLTTPLSAANGGTGLTSLGTGIATFLGTPTSANLAAAVTDETGTGALVFGTTPTFTTSALFPAGTLSAPGISVSGDTNTGIYFPAADTIGFVEGGVEAMRLDASGNLGLGVTPSAKFDVQTSSNKRIQFTDASHNTLTGLASAILFSRGSDTANLASIFGCDTGGLAVAAREGIIFATGGLGTYTVTSRAMTLDSSGNLLVGTTNTSGATGNGIKCLIADGGAGAPRIAISTSASTSSTFSFSTYSTDVSAYRFYVRDDGQIVATQTSIIAVSDASLKKNIRPLETGLAEVLELQPRRFDWINGDGNNVAGFIAQEVEPVLPDLVSDYQYTDTVTKRAVKMGDMLPTVVRAIQELAAKVSALEAKQ